MFIYCLKVDSVFFIITSSYKTSSNAIYFIVEIRYEHSHKVVLVTIWVALETETEDEPYAEILGIWELVHFIVTDILVDITIIKNGHKTRVWRKFGNRLSEHTEG